MVDSFFTPAPGGGAGSQGPEGPQGPAGATGPAGPAGELDILTDVDAYATQQWPGPFPVITGTGAPTSGTGAVGDFYLDTTDPTNAVLYGPKQSDDTWPLIGNQNVAYFAGTIDPVDQTTAAVSPGSWYLKFAFTPPSTVTPLNIWGPFTASGVSDRSYLGYKQSTRTWEATNGDYVLNTDGGGYRALVASATGNFSLNPNLFSFFEFTLTGNLNLAAFPSPGPRLPGGAPFASHLVVAVKQGGSGNYSVTWPTAVTWPGGVAPTLSTRVGDVDFFHLVSYDRGVSWSGIQMTSGTGPQRVEKVADKTADYTFTRADAGNIVTLSGSNNRTFTVPTNANVPLPIGTRITVATVANGHILVAGDSGVTVTGTTTLNTAGQVATLIKIGADAWVVHH